MFNLEEIKEEASLCYQCKNKPCKLGCPLNNDIPTFISLIKENKLKEAYQILEKTTVLPSICGRICPHIKQCQGNCIKRFKSEPIKIGKLESFLGDLALENNWSTPINIPLKNKKIAIVGGGPAGLSCAAVLRKNGYNVTIYEKHNYLGGLLYHGIPDFRLDKEVLKRVIDNIINLGIDVKLNQSIGKDFSLETLKEKYDAIFLSFGANIASKMKIPGENLIGVYGGNELLEGKDFKEFFNKEIIIIGCGDVAIDVALTLKRNKAKKVTIVYRRSKQEAPALKEDIDKAKKLGIEFLFQNNIIKIIGRDKVEEVELVKTDLIKRENETRLYPINIENSNYTIPCNYVIMAIGSIPEENIVKKLNLNIKEDGRIIIDKVGHTSNKKVFAGGDLAGIKSTVAFASKSGIDSAYAIIDYLENLDI